MIKKPILVDVDGVCADFVTPTLELINSTHKTNFKYSEMIEDVKPWVGPKYWTSDIEDTIRSPGYASKFTIIPGSQEAIETMRKNGDRVIFLTSPYSNSPTWAHDRTMWLKEHFGAERDDIIFARDKRFVVGQTLIDDKFTNVRDWSAYQNKQTGILFVQPWNEREQESTRLTMMLGGTLRDPKENYYLLKAKNWSRVLEIIYE